MVIESIKHIVYPERNLFVPLDVLAAIQKKDVRITGGAKPRPNPNPPVESDGPWPLKSSTQWLHRFWRKIRFS